VNYGNLDDDGNEKVPLESLLLNLSALEMRFLLLLLISQKVAHLGQLKSHLSLFHARKMITPNQHI